MPHGQPDFGMYSIAATIHRLADMGELAARLGAINVFDRRGNVICFDDFESGVEKWYGTGSGSGYAVAADAEYAKGGGFSCKLTTGATSGGLASITRYLPYPALSKLGFELAFTMRQHVYEYHLWMYVYDGVNRHKAEARYLYLGPPAGNDILQVNDNGTWTDIATGLYAYALAGYEFHIMKLVADFGNGVYTRLIFDDAQYNISAYSLKSETNPTGSHMTVYCKVVNDTTAQSFNINVDDAIITQNEP